MERFLIHIEQGLHEERGFSTVGVALALLISLALIFSAAQVYEVSSVSADIQETADVAALAAENVVGEYCVVATLCDAIALSLSLSSLCCLGLSVAAACTPVTISLSESLLKSAQKLKQTQRSFVEKAQDALERLKTILPLAAAAKAAQVISANSNIRGEAGYTGIAILVPWETNALEEQDHGQSDAAFESTEKKKDLLEELGKEAEEAAQRTNALKEEAYRFDSGSESTYCMYERAKTLAHLGGNENPFYSSAETWDFDVALERARAYYRARATNEAPEGNSVAQRARSALRKRFYQFASSELDHGYVRRTADGFDVHFPLLPKNTEEMKQTILYTESRYPRSISASGKSVLHAFEGCPTYVGQPKSGRGSLEQMDNDPSYEVCPSCQFAPSSLGSVGAASSAIDNGFEYHYRKVAELAQAYTEEHKKLNERSSMLKEQADDLFSHILDAFTEAKDARIKIDPPGKYGAIAFVATTNPGRGSFLSQFVDSSSNLRARAAVSAATLLPESTDSGKNAINSILDSYAEAGMGGASGASRIALDLWSGLLVGYEEGQISLVESLSDAVNALPLASESGLGQWAADRLEEALQLLDLQPVDLSPQKAVLVNSAHVARADDSAFGVRFVDMKIANLGRNSYGELFDYTLEEAESAITDAIDNAEFTIEIATIEIVQGSIEIPLTITLPQPMKDAANSLVHQAFSALESQVASFIYRTRWQ